MRKPIGWRNEPGRHSLAARGVRTRPSRFSPREEVRFRYAGEGAFNLRNIRSSIEDHASEYDNFETSEGRARYLHDKFTTRSMWTEKALEESGLSYEYESDPPRIVVSLYDEEWFDSEKDRMIPSWDFTVMVAVLTTIISENIIREDLRENIKQHPRKRWEISLREDIEGENE